MAAPDLTKRMTVFVQKEGSDDATANAVGHPQSRLTIAAALADLAANYDAASSTFYHIVALGPGAYPESAFSLPPWTFIEGTCDGESNIDTEIQLSGNLTLSAAWSANSTQRGGIGNVRIRAASGTPIIDFTLPVPVAGNPARTVETWNVRHNLTQELFEANSTADVRRRTNTVQDGVNTDVITDVGGSSLANGFNLAAALVTVKDKTSFAMAAVWQGFVATAVGATLTVQSVAAAGCTMRLTQSAVRALTLTETAPGVVAMSADGISLPVKASVTFGGTAVNADLTRISDAFGEGYTPTTAANWPAIPPTNVQEGLDMLAASVVPAFKTTNYGTSNNAAGNTSITPDAQIYTYLLTVTVADVRTSVAILVIPAGLPAGAIIFLTMTSAINGVTIQVRNATAGGTLLDSWSTTDASYAGRFPYNGAAFTRGEAQVPA